MDSRVYRLPVHHDPRIQEGAAVEVLRLMRLLVPAVALGEAEVVRIVRAPGYAVKAAIACDGLGKVLGRNGSHVRALRRRLGGERVDLVRYDDDLLSYVRSALLPGYAGRMRLAGERLVEVFPSPEEAGHVIGQGGLNVRLAALLTRARIRVVQERPAS
jgi:N utilization substance protein A